MKQSKPTKQAQDLADGTVSSYFYPEHGISIVAEDKAAADKKISEQIGVKTMPRIIGRLTSIGIGKETYAALRSSRLTGSRYAP